MTIRRLARAKRSCRAVGVGGEAGRGEAERSMETAESARVGGEGSGAAGKDGGGGVGDKEGGKGGGLYRSESWMARNDWKDSREVEKREESRRRALIDTNQKQHELVLAKRETRKGERED